MIPFQLPFPRFLRGLFGSMPLALGFNSSKSSASSSSSSTVYQEDNRVGVEGENAVVASDQAVVNIVNQDVSAEAIEIAARANAAVSQEAINSAQESARVAASASLQATQVAQESARLAASAALQATQAAQESARVAISGNVQVSQSAIAASQEAARVASAASVASAQASQESARVAVAGVVQGTARALDTVDRSISAVNNVATIATENARDIVLDNNALTEKTRQGNQELVKLVADKLSTAVADERQNINSQVIEKVTTAGIVITLGLGAFLLFR